MMGLSIAGLAGARGERYRTGGGGGGEALPGALPGLHGQALPRALAAQPQFSLGLYLDQDIFAGPRPGGQGAAAGRASAQAAAAADDRHADSPGCFAALLD
jgi:hypothetical protein